MDDYWAWRHHEDPKLRTMDMTEDFEAQLAELEAEIAERGGEAPPAEGEAAPAEAPEEEPGISVVTVVEDTGDDFETVFDDRYG